MENIKLTKEVKSTNIILEERAKKIAEDITNNNRVIVLLLDLNKSNEPFMTFPYKEQAKIWVDQGKKGKSVTLNQYRKWVETSTHKYNNNLRKRVLELL